MENRGRLQRTPASGGTRRLRGTQELMRLLLDTEAFRWWTRDGNHVNRQIPWHDLTIVGGSLPEHRQIEFHRVKRREAAPNGVRARTQYASRRVRHARD